MPDDVEWTRIVNELKEATEGYRRFGFAEVLTPGKPPSHFPADDMKEWRKAKDRLDAADAAMLDHLRRRGGGG